MKATKNSFSTHLRVKKKKKAFSISSSALADAVANYKADGGEITQLNISTKREEDKRAFEDK